MAVRVLDESGPWAAGQRLMQAADPESWALIVAASPLTDANRETVQKCREQAEKAEKPVRSEEHTSELQSLMLISYAVFCLKTKKNSNNKQQSKHSTKRRPNTDNKSLKKKISYTQSKQE